MWGGGAGDASFGGGAGGGFGGAGGFGSPMDGSQEKRKSFNKGQSLMPVTAAQLYAARHDEDGSFYVNERELNYVTFIGVVRTVEETSTTLSYSVDDMTGEPMQVRKYIQDNETRRSECREGLFVRVAGHLRSYNETSRNVIAFVIQPVTEFNDITLHMLEVVHAHLYLKKGGSAAPAVKTEGAMGSTGMGAGSGGGAATGGMAMGSNAMGFDKDQHQVYKAIMACRDTQGLNIRMLLDQMRKHSIMEPAVRKAVDWLSQEGHIYSTIDDEHFKSTDDF
ncbi:replication protein A 32 kDa subunit-B-like [Sycon ciliatum]|uniref:replication protein A 32 kDa subunit-B-like n=1 Tax=Sycon ciliatum TaxID=27933 RepID=UPI0020AD9C8A|eukprot:scpid66343/ scgid9532/ Replication protein A 32 kDa subunit; Replication factor A protein 2; Replication protein A 34 kDa subunit